MILFEKTGKENTARVVEVAVEKAVQLGCDIVIASYSGESARVLLERVRACDFPGKVVVVRGVSSAAMNGKNRMSAQTKQELEAMGAVVVTTAHALSAGERGLSTSFQGVYPLEIMAHTLRTFGQGTKVGFEGAVMALDADAIAFGKPVVSLGGSAGGQDTAIVITPSYSATITKTVIHEILCKPALYPQEY